MMMGSMASTSLTLAVILLCSCISVAFDSTDPLQAAFGTTQSLPSVSVLVPKNMSHIHLDPTTGLVAAKIEIRNFQIPADGDVCILFYGQKKCGEGRPLPPGVFSNGVLSVNLRVPLLDFDAGWHQLDVQLVGTLGEQVATGTIDINIIPPHVEALRQVRHDKVRVWDPWAVRTWSPTRAAGRPLPIIPIFYFLYNDAHLKIKFMNSQMATAGGHHMRRDGKEQPPYTPMHVSVPWDSSKGRRMLAGSAISINETLFLFYSAGEPWPLPRGESGILLASSPYVPGLSGPPARFEEVNIHGV